MENYLNLKTRRWKYVALPFIRYHITAHLYIKQKNKYNTRKPEWHAVLPQVNYEILIIVCTLDSEKL